VDEEGGVTGVKEALEGPVTWMQAPRGIDYLTFSTCALVLWPPLNATSPPHHPPLPPS
jgi:hypothetical protein